MKRKIKKTLTLTQQRLLVRITLVILVVAVLWLLFAPKMGVIALYKDKERLQTLEDQRAELEKENSDLRSEIDRINNDIEYFEYLARKHGLVKENEIIFDFSPKDTKKK